MSDAAVGTVVATPATVPVLLPALSLWQREVVRFLRQRSRVVGALGSPIVFWLLIGLGVGQSIQAPGLPAGASYLQYFFPGTLVLILLFTSIFSTISIIDDRKEGFLQSVLVAPVPRLSVVLAKVLGGTTLAVLQGGLFLLLAPLAGIPVGVGSAGAALGLMAIIAFGLTSLGFFFAWRMESTQGFHAIMNLVLIPIWLLSGALFPVEGAHRGVAAVMRLNPVSYCVDSMRQVLFPSAAAADVRLAPFAVCLAVTVGFAVAAFGATVWISRQRSGADVR